MNTEISSILEQDGRLISWAEAVKYNRESNEDKDISSAMDAFIREVGESGLDRDHEIAALIKRAITPDVIAIPDAVIDALFEDVGTIGEFDDWRAEKEPENTIKVYDAVVGGNVNRSYIDFTALTPTHRMLQAETEIPLIDIRRGGYRTVATVIDKIREAMDQKKYAALIAAADAAVTSGMDGYITEATAAPTNVSANELALYVLDHGDGDAAVAFGQYKYIQAMGNLTGATTFMSDAAKDYYTANGIGKQYAGLNLYGFSGTKKLADGTLIMPTKRVFAAAGKIGQICTRGETRVYESTDIDREVIHIKVNGYDFSYAITNPEKLGKIVMSL